MRPSIILLISLFVVGLQASAQPRGKSAGPTDCESKLAQAEEAYLSGRVLQALTLIEACALRARASFSQEDGIRAMSLLTILYEATNQTPKAEETMVALLHRYPRYKPSEEAAHYHLVGAWQKYGARPGIQLAVGGGPLWALVHSTRSWQVAQGTPYTDYFAASPGNMMPSQAYYDTLANYGDIIKKFSPESGYFYNAKLNFILKNNIYLNTEFSINRYRWKEKMPYDWINEPWDTVPFGAVMHPSANPNGKLNTWDYIAALRLDYLRVGAGLHWDIRPWTSKGIQPYVEAGFSFQWAASSVKKNKKQNSISIYKPFATATFYGGIFPAGDSLDVITQSPVTSKPDSIFVPWASGWYSEIGVSLGQNDLSYRLGVKVGGVFGNLVNPENRYSDPVALYTFSHIEDDLSMQWVALQASMVYTFRYSVYPKKRRSS